MGWGWVESEPQLSPSFLDTSPGLRNPFSPVEYKSREICKLFLVFALLPLSQGSEHSADAWLGGGSEQKTHRGAKAQIGEIRILKYHPSHTCSRNSSLTSLLLEVQHFVCPVDLKRRLPHTCVSMPTHLFPSTPCPL